MIISKRIGIIALAIAGWFSLHASQVQAQLAISEVMYNPLAGDSHEYVELVNTTGAQLNVSGWGFSEGIQFVFPENSVVPPGGYIVVCRNVENFKTRYPEVAEEQIFGPFEGRLSNSDDQLTILTSDLTFVDSMSYQDDSPWDFLADGFGASLERLCNSEDGHSSINWRAGEVPKEPAVNGGSPGRANRAEQCPPQALDRPSLLISEIMYHPVLEESLVENHEFIELYNSSDSAIDLEGIRLAGGIDFVFPEGATIGAKDYVVVAKNMRRLNEPPGYDVPAEKLFGDYERELDNGGEKVAIIGKEGQGIESVTYNDDFPWPVAADALGAGRSWLNNDLLPLEDHRFRGYSLERVNTDIPAGFTFNWALSPLDGATPGKANASAREVPLTIVEDIDIDPVTPVEGDDLIRQNQEVRVTVEFSPSSFDGQAQLEWFVEDLASNNEEKNTIALKDDGQDGDLVAGDRIFSAIIPRQTNNSVVRYRVHADRGDGLEQLAPRTTDPNPWFSYFVSPNIASNSKIYHLFVSPQNWGRMWTNIGGGRVAGCNKHPTWNNRVPAIFVYDGEVFDIQARYQGSRWNRRNGRTITRWTGPRPTAGGLQALSWRIYLPRFQQFGGRQDLILNKLTQGCPGYNAGVGYKLFRLAGVPGARADYIRVHVNGNYYHYMLDLERGGEEMLRDYHDEIHDLDPTQPREPVGHLYKSVGCTCDEGPYGWGDYRLLPPLCGHTSSVRYAATYDKKTHDWAGNAPLVQLIEDLHQARRGGTAAIREFFEKNFDIELTMSYMAIINWAVPFDDMFQNHFIYQRASDGKWFFIPWDLDRNFGEWQGANSSIFMGVQGDASNRSGWWNYMKDGFLKAFRTEYEDHLLLLNNTILHPDNVAMLVDEFAAKADFDEAAASPAGTGCSYSGRVSSFKSFANQRFTRVNTLIAGVEVDAGPDILIFEGGIAQFDASETTPEPSEDVVYSWSNGMEGVTPSLKYEEPGLYTVVLTVTSRGVDFTDEVIVEVIDIPDQVHLEKNGEVVLEAESYFEDVRRDSDRTWWVHSQEQPNFSGEDYMHAHEEIRKSFTSRYVGIAPELRYAIHFETPGVYRVWLRGYVFSTRNDSFHVNFNGGARSSRWAQQFEVDDTGFTWSGDTSREGPQLLTVEEPGVKLFSVWLKESTSSVDKIVLTQDVEKIITGLGPDESPRGVPGAAPNAFIRGDINGSKTLDISDCIGILLYMFQGAQNVSCEDHADFDDNGNVEIADSISLIRYLFLKGEAPPEPFPNPGTDPTPDANTCGDAQPGV